MPPPRRAALAALAGALALAFAATANASDKPETVSTIIRGMCDSGAVPSLPVGPHRLDLTAHLCGGKAAAAVQPAPTAAATPPPASLSKSVRSEEAPAVAKPPPSTSSTSSPFARKALVDAPVLAALAIIALIIGIPAIVALIVAIVSRRRRSRAQRLAAEAAPGGSAPRRASRGAGKAAAAPTYIDVAASAAGSKSGRPVARRGTPSNL